MLETWLKYRKGHFVLARNVDNSPCLAQVTGQRGRWRWRVMIGSPENHFVGDETNQRRAMEVAQQQLKARIQEFKYAR